MWLLDQLDGEPETYRAFAAEYYEVVVDLAPVEHVYRHRPLTDEVVQAVNGDLVARDLLEDVPTIGYPS